MRAFVLQAVVFVAQLRLNHNMCLVATYVKSSLCVEGLIGCGLNLFVCKPVLCKYRVCVYVSSVESLL